MDGLFSLRDALPKDKALIDTYTYGEGMDFLPSLDNVRVAVNGDDEVVGFIRVQYEDDAAYVNPMVVCTSWRGYGVGRALMEEALARTGGLKLVSRGGSRGFYERMGFTPTGWDDIAPAIASDCDGCPLRDECNPQPMKRAAPER